MPLYHPTISAGPRMRSGYYYPVGAPAGATFGGTAHSMTADLVWFAPYVVGSDSSVVGLAADVDTGIASSVLRFGIYYDTGRGIPGNLLVDGGTVSSATTGAKEVTFTAVTLKGAELYWIAVVAQVAATVVIDRHSNAVKEYVGRSSLDQTNTYSVWTQAGVTGALPATATPAADGNSGFPGLLVKAA